MDHRSRSTGPESGAERTVPARTCDGFVAAGTQRAPLRVVVGLTVRLSLVLEKRAVLEWLLAVLEKGVGGGVRL